MSIEVPLADLPDTLERHPWGYLITVRPDLRAQSLAVPTEWRDGALHLDAGDRTRANAAARPEVTMVFPPAEPGGYSLIVDGVAAEIDGRLAVTPTWAVLHRPAIS